ncbi:hypothetical protein LXL04_021961 [Taraxacum kok-saghyz]
MYGYTRWSRHGELLIDRNMVDIECNDDDQTDYFEDDNNDKLDDMLHDIEDEVPDKDHLKFQQLFDDAEKPLYVGCTKFTKLSAVLKLMNLKATHGWSDKSFTDTLETLHEMLPDDNELPVSTYQAKKLMCPMSLEIERIHACPNDCMFYRDQYADLDKCVTCGTSRYKKKNETEVNDNVKKNAPAAKVLWIGKKDGKIRHVADSPQWRNIDYEFKEFGPKQPGNDIDVYLAPLIEDMKILWNSGVDVYDAYNKECFRLRAMIFCTISDFPAYANLSGYSTKGKKACPVCENDTQSLWLENCKKVVYMGHRRSLPISHEYRQMGNLFDGTIEKGKGAHPMTGRTSFSRVQNLNIVFGKSSKSGQIDNWKKRSIFWELPYWEKLDVRHCLDVMHIEKNVCESLIGLLLNIKSKDGLSVRKDMVKMGIRPELAPIEKDKKRTYLPPACYTMSKNEKKSFCECLHGVKVPSGYSANIKRLVSMKDLKLLGTMGQPARKKRSVSMIKEKPKHKLVNLHIEFNELGEAIGKNRFEFTTYCGVTVKTRISILQCWNEVSEAEIDELWLNIKTHWNIPNDDYKAQVLKVCNQQWRTYKSKLLKFMDKGIDPLKEFPYLEKETWKTFVKEKSTPEFQDIRVKATASVKMNKNPPLLGPLGYRGNRPRWEKEMESGEMTKVRKISSRRARDYIFARLKRDASGALRVTPQIEPIVDALVEKQNEVTQADSEIAPGSDLLVEVLGPEHPVLKEMKDKQEDHSTLIADMREEITMLRREMAGNRNIDVTSPVVNQTSFGSAPMVDVLDNITVATECELLLPYGMVQRKCAKGQVFPCGNGILHTFPMQKDHVRVSVDKIYNGYDSLPTIQKKRQETKRMPPIANKPTVMPKKLQDSLMIQSWYSSFTSHKYVEEFHVESEPGIFGPARIETYIRPEVILEMLNREELDINCIIGYQM